MMRVFADSVTTRNVYGTPVYMSNSLAFFDLIQEEVLSHLLLHPRLEAHCLCIGRSAV